MAGDDEPGSPGGPDGEGSVQRKAGTSADGPTRSIKGDTNNNSDSAKELPYKNTSEYCVALNHWMVQVWNYQCLQQMSFQMFSSGATLSGATTFSSSQQQPLSQGGNRPFAAAAGTPLNANANVPGGVADGDAGGRVYILPKIWKRVLAEMIDFLFLLVLKVMVTYIAIDSFELVDLDKYDVNILEEEFDAYQLAYELTSEIIIIESVHRLLVVAFETFCLAKAQGTNRVGGATPGKSLLGLKVISCSHVEDLGNGTIRVTPAQDIGYWWALLRALIKNLSSVFFLPASLTIFVSSHNRAAYDIACKCIVVENISINPRRHVN